MEIEWSLLKRTYVRMWLRPSSLTIDWIEVFWSPFLDFVERSQGDG
jgi:hypothetical protein